MKVLTIVILIYTLLFAPASLCQEVVWKHDASVKHSTAESLQDSSLDINLSMIDINEINDDNKPKIYENEKFELYLENFCGGDPNDILVIKKNIKFYLDKLPSVLNRFEAKLEDLELKELDVKKLLPVKVFLGIDGNESCDRIEVQKPGDIHITMSKHDIVLNHHLQLLPHELFHVVEDKLFGESNDIYHEAMADIFWRFYFDNQFVGISSRNAEVDESALILQMVEESNRFSEATRDLYRSLAMIRSPGYDRSFNKDIDDNDLVKYSVNPYFVSSYINSKIENTDMLKSVIKEYIKKPNLFNNPDIGEVLKNIGVKSDINIKKTSSKDFEFSFNDSDQEGQDISVKLPEDLRGRPVMVGIKLPGQSEYFSIGHILVEENEDSYSFGTLVHDGENVDQLSIVREMLLPYGAHVFSSEKPFIVSFVSNDEQGNLVSFQQKINIKKLGLYHIHFNGFTYHYLR